MAPPPAAQIPPPPEPETTQTPATAQLPPPREPFDQDPGHGKRFAGLTLMGAGVAATTVGIVFGLKAKSAADDVSSLSSTGGTWTAEFADKQSAGQRDETIGAIGISLGVAAIVGGGILYYLGATEKPEPSPVAVGIGSGGGHVVFSWQY